MTLSEFKENAVALLKNKHSELQEALRLSLAEQDENAQRLREAKEQGDLSENAEYQAAAEEAQNIALKRQRIMEKIQALNQFQPMRSSTINEGTAVRLSSDRFIPLTGNPVADFYLVPTKLSDIKQGLLSVNSPVALAITGKTAGSSVIVQTAVGTHNVKILEVSF